MSDRAAIATQITEALREAKPITRDTALQIANDVMRAADPSLMSDFDAWFKKHGDALVEKINNG